MSKNKLLLIDGSGILVANYYGTIPPEVMYAKTDEEKEKAYSKISKRNGLYMNAIYPTIKQIFEMALKSDATHIAVSFDKSRKNTFRTKMYDEYKGTRKPSPQPLNEQFILCEHLLSQMNIPVFYCDLYEADDLVGSIGKQLESNDTEVIMYTRDKDYLQLVDDNITVWMGVHKQEIATNMLEKYCLTKELGYDDYIPDKTIPYTPVIVKNEKGVDAEDFYNVLGLMGDTADNIPGVKGVSENVAEKLIGEYHTIENLYDEIACSIEDDRNQELKDYWKENLGIKRSPMNALISQKDNALLSAKLAKIKTDIDMNEFTDFSLDALKCPNDLLDFKPILDKNENQFRKMIREKAFALIDDIGNKEKEIER